MAAASAAMESNAEAAAVLLQLQRDINSLTDNNRALRSP
jgi:hypothetical protein